MKSGFDLKNLDPFVRPQNDFFRYAVGGWLKRNPIPRTESRWGNFDVLRDRATRALNAILADISRNPARPGSDARKLRDFYRTAMDAKKQNRDGLRPLAPYLKQIRSISSKKDFFRFLGKMHGVGICPFWIPIVDQDEKKSERMAFHLWQGELVLPDREYYLRADKRSRLIRKKYVRYAVRMLGRAGHDSRAAKKIAERVLAFETKIANVSEPREKLREAEKQYHKMAVGELSKIAPGIPWRAYFSAIGAPKFSTLIVGQPRYLRALDRIIAAEPLEDLKRYAAWVLLDRSAPFLGDRFVRERFSFHGKVLSGTKELRPRWKRITMLTDALMGEALGKRYVSKHFRPAAKRKINAMAERLVRAYERRIQALDWMSSRTKERALKKLRAIRWRLGYPDKWKSYRALEIKTDSYLENYFRAQRFEHRRLLAKIGKKVDRKEWIMTPPTVNACFNPTMNTLEFPAGILQPPFFDPKASDAVNYGAIGSVIGHELTHGFDDQGSKFDADGNLREWWLAGDRKKFVKKAGILVKQFDAFSVAGGMRLNGRMTLGENIADLGGLLVAYDAFCEARKGRRSQKIKGTFSEDQLFFLGYAQFECGHLRPEEERRLATIDPHSPSRYRVNGIFPHIAEFHRAFNVAPGDPMFHKAKDRAKIW